MSAGAASVRLVEPTRAFGGYAASCSVRRGAQRTRNVRLLVFVARIVLPVGAMARTFTT
jgi:hypothetical protein